jgi:hypothetical protein
VRIERSRNSKKKFDVYRDGKFQASIGARGYMDYEKYLRKDGEAKANQHRRAYRARHGSPRKTRDGKLTAGYLAQQILW